MLPTTPSLNSQENFEFARAEPVDDLRNLVGGEDLGLAEARPGCPEKAATAPIRACQAGRALCDSTGSQGRCQTAHRRLDL